MNNEQISKELLRGAFGAFFISFIFAIIITVMPANFLRDWITVITFLTGFGGLITLIGAVITRYS